MNIIQKPSIIKSNLLYNSTSIYITFMLIAFYLIPTDLPAQITVNGTYYTQFNKEEKKLKNDFSYYFYKDSLFVYKEYGFHSHTKVSSGVFKLINDTLKLFYYGKYSFENLMEVFDHEVKKEDSINGYSTLDFTVILSHSYAPLANCFIGIFDENNKKLDMLQTDSMGKASTKITDMNGDFMIAIYYAGTRINFGNIKLNGRKEISIIYDRPGFSANEEKKKINYKIVADNKEKMVVKEGDTTITLFKK